MVWDIEFRFISRCRLVWTHDGTMCSTQILIPFIMILRRLKILLWFILVSPLLSRDWSLMLWLESLGVLTYTLEVSLWRFFEPVFLTIERDLFSLLYPILSWSRFCFLYHLLLQGMAHLISVFTHQNTSSFCQLSRNWNDFSPCFHS